MVEPRILSIPSTVHPGGGGVVLDPVLPTGDTPWRWLEPAAYGEAARAIRGRGGRGAAWFVMLPDGTDGVLRQYRRGGLPARLGARELYVWQGEERTRCLREFRLLRRLAGAGLPVPQALAAAWWRTGGFWYRQALLTRRLEGTRSLAESLQANDADIPWSELGRTLARFHLAGVGHPDLNAHNILIDAALQPWLIDFDRGGDGPLASGEAAANLARLQRSIRRITRDPALPPGWEQLQAAWQAAMA